MRFAFVCLSVTLLTQVCQKTCAADQPDVETIFAECQAQHGVSESEFPSMEKEPSTVAQNLKCFTHCLVENMQLLDEDGQLDDVKFLDSNIMPSAQSEVISDCKAKHAMTEDPCEYIFDLFYCFRA